RYYLIYYFYETKIYFLWRKSCASISQHPRAGSLPVLRDRTHAKVASVHSEGRILSLTAPTAGGTHGTGAHGQFIEIVDNIKVVMYTLDGEYKQEDLSCSRGTVESI